VRLRSPHTLLICSLIAIGTIVAYWQLQHCGFILLDDSDYLVDNSFVRDGLTWKSISWAFGATHSANWHPLTWLSHMLDCELYGLNPGLHHLTNLAIHIANSVLLFLLLSNVTKRLWRSAWTAALFAVHPMHVESVAWISERKDVLSTLFLIMTVWSYCLYARPRSAAATRFAASRSKIVWYFTTLILFACGLMSKPMLVTVPFLLLILDYWPLERIEPAAIPFAARKALLPLLVEKIPFFALSIASSAITLLVQHHGAAIRTFHEYPVMVRVETILIGYISYLWKVVWPADLIILYPNPGSWPVWQIVTAFLFLVCLSVIVFLLRAHKYLVTGWLWYLSALVPVIGIVPVGAHVIADRYSYVPLIGIFIMAAWSAGELCIRYRKLALPLTVMFSVSIGISAFITKQQVRYWHDSVALFQHALDVTIKRHNKNDLIDASFISLGRDNLGLALASKGKLDEAILQYAQALDFHPELPPRKNSDPLTDPSNKTVETSLAIQPDFAAIHDHFGQTLAKLNRGDEALSHFEIASRLKPDDAIIHFHLAMILADLGDTKKCISEYHTALRINPTLTDAMNNLAWLLATSSNPTFRSPAEAVDLAQKACAATEYRKPIMIGTLAAAYAESGQFAEAIASAEKARALALSKGETDVADKNTELLELYRAGKAYHESGK
jgi:hypothetical protein